MERDFGRYLLSVMERDIDLLLMEEFHVSSEFVTWFSVLAGVADAEFDGAWHSVSDQDGETDLLLRVRCGHERIAILIENKVAAPQRPLQDERYHLRAARAREAGLYERHIVCVCAPSWYLQRLRAESLYQSRVPYESIRDWYASQPGPRAAWRRRIIEEAIDQSRRGYTLIESSAKTAFHRQYWDYVRKRHPSFVIRRPTPKGAKSHWMHLKTRDMPEKVILSHKNDMGCLDLSFRGTRVTQLLAVRTDWPEGIIARQCGKSAVLRILVPILDMESSLETQEAALEVVLSATRRLTPFSRILEHPQGRRLAGSSSSPNVAE